MKKLRDKISKKLHREAKPQHQQGESSSQPPPGIASSSEQATTPAPPPLQSSPVSSLTPSRFSREFTAQNQGRDSVDSNRPIPRYMLHGTSEDNAAEILKTGLETSKGGQEGGASKKRGDPKYVENSQGVVHGTPSRKVANAYAEYHDKPIDGGKNIEKNSAVIGFRNVHPESTKRDPDSRASYAIDKSIPSNQVVPVRPEKVAEGQDPTGLFIP